MPLASIGRRRWLQAVLASAGATLALPRAMADPAAVTPIRKLCDSLLGIMRAGHATPFPQRFETLAPVVGTHVRSAGDPATVGRAVLVQPRRPTSKPPC